MFYLRFNFEYGLLLVVLFHYFSWFVLLLLYLFVLYEILALWPPTLQYQLPALLCFVLILSGETKQNQGRGLVDCKLDQAPTFRHPPPPPPPFPKPVILLLVVPRRLLCFGFRLFGGFRCGVWLCLLFLIDIKIENR